MKVARLIELLNTMDGNAEIKIACSGMTLATMGDYRDPVDELDIASVYADGSGAVWIDGEP